MTSIENLRAPMASAPFKYNSDGTVDWGNMWDSFCVLASQGGPPHRGELLLAPANPQPEHADYQQVAAELSRGIWEVSGLPAQPDEPGWLAVRCPSAGMAHWLAGEICQENVQARARGAELLLPLSERFTLKGEIKNVITAVAKTSHYWNEHLPAEARLALDLQQRLAGLQRRLRTWFRRDAS